MQVTKYKSISKIKLHIVSLISKQFDYRVPIRAIEIYFGNLQLASDALLMDYNINESVTLNCVKRDQIIAMYVFFLCKDNFIFLFFFFVLFCFCFFVFFCLILYVK